jgi:hypothetical protein
VGVDGGDSRATDQFNVTVGVIFEETGNDALNRADQCGIVTLTMWSA